MNTSKVVAVMAIGLVAVQGTLPARAADEAAPNPLQAAEIAPSTATPLTPAGKPPAPVPTPKNQAKPAAPAPSKTNAPDPDKLVPTPIAELSEKWGIEVVALRNSAGGYMLDFRYRVLDAAKAAPLFEHRAAACLIDEETGARFAVPAPPKVGSLRASGTPQAGKIYFVLFANPGNFIKVGKRAAIVIGDLKIEHLAVE